MNTASLSSMLKEIYDPEKQTEGWHGIYKKYGWRVLARDNYRWKRKIMKRFGPNVRMRMRIAYTTSSPMWEVIKASRPATPRQMRFKLPSP